MESTGASLLGQQKRVFNQRGEADAEVDIFPQGVVFLLRLFFGGGKAVVESLFVFVYFCFFYGPTCFFRQRKQKK